MSTVVATLALQVRTTYSGPAGMDYTQHTVGPQVWTAHSGPADMDYTQWAYRYGLHTAHSGPAGMDCTEWACRYRLHVVVLQVWTAHSRLQSCKYGLHTVACRYRLHTVGLHRGRLGVSEGREITARLLHRPDLAPGDRSRIFTLVISFASSSKSVSPTPKAGGHRVSLELRCPLLASQREPSV